MRVAIILLLTALLGIPTWAAALDPAKVGLGARSIALGRTSAALEADPGAIFANPANAAALPGPGLKSMYANLSEDISYTFLGAATPWPLGTFGLAYLGNASAGFQSTTIEAGRVVGAGSSFDYSSSVLNLIYGRELREDLAVGANFKLFNKGFSAVANGSGSGYDLDLGLLWKPRPELLIGLAQQNTLPFSLARISWGSGAEEGIPFNTKLGASYAPRRDLLLAADLNYAANVPLTLHGGVEWKMLKWLALRAGVDQLATGASAVATNYCGGVGLNFNDLSFDYAYYYDTVLSETNSAHYFSLAYLINEPYPVPKPVPPPVPETSPTVEVKLRSFKDVPWGYWAKGPIELLGGLGIIGGFPDGTFQPDRTVTRAELVTLLVRAKVGTLPSHSLRGFRDLPANHWALPYVDKAVELELAKGYPDRTFRPGLAVTRAEGIAILSRFDDLKLAPVFERPFTDLPVIHWAAPAVAAARAAGWLDYLPGMELKPNQPLTRAEVAEILARTAFIKRQAAGQ